MAVEQGMLKQAWSHAASRTDLGMPVTMMPPCITTLTTLFARLLPDHSPRLIAEEYCPAVRCQAALKALVEAVKVSRDPRPVAVVSRAADLLMEETDHSTPPRIRVAWAAVAASV